MADDAVNISVHELQTSAPSTKLINNVPVTSSDVEIDPARSLWFRVFTPNTNSGAVLPLIVYFHGGSFRRFAPDTTIFDDLCSHLAARIPAVVASVNYRLAPEFKYPTQYEDGCDALKFIDAQSSAFLPSNADPGSCFIGGDSAGGNIAHHVTVRALQKDGFLNKVRIIGVLSLQPFFGGEERTESELRLVDAPVINVGQSDVYWRDFLPEGADRNHPAVHVFSGGEEVKEIEFPPSLVIVGGKDPLQDWGKRYVEWLKSCGKEAEVIMYPDAIHAFYVFAGVHELESLFQKLASFVKKQMHPN